MKMTKKIIVSFISILIASIVTFSFHTTEDVLGQLSSGKDITQSNYHVEIAVLAWIVCAIINAVVWLKKEKKHLVKKIDFDFLNTEKEMHHEK